MLLCNGSFTFSKFFFKLAFFYQGKTIQRSTTDFFNIRKTNSYDTLKTLKNYNPERSSLPEIEKKKKNAFVSVIFTPYI